MCVGTHVVKEGSLVSEALGATWGGPRAVQQTSGSPGATVHREEQPSGTVDKGGQGLHKGRVSVPIVPARERRIGTGEGRTTRPHNGRPRGVEAVRGADEEEQATARSRPTVR